MKPTTKEGKHGTLYLYEISYNDKDAFGQIMFWDTHRTWAYSIEHALEKFYDADDGNHADTIRRVPESGPIHLSPIHNVAGIGSSL